MRLDEVRTEQRAKYIEALAQFIVPDAGMEFKTSVFAHMLGPGVYIAIKDSEPIYIGMSKNFLARFGKHHHEAEILASDTIKFIPCRSIESAYMLESILIEVFDPCCNIRKKHTNAARMAANALGSHNTSRIITQYAHPQTS